MLRDDFGVLLKRVQAHSQTESSSYNDEYSLFPHNKSEGFVRTYLKCLQHTQTRREHQRPCKPDHSYIGVPVDVGNNTLL